MHVDDYVARERNADGSNNSNVIAVPRIGSSSGRPPSIHVDEFMARQRERQNSVGLPVTDVAAAQEKLAPVENKADVEKSTMPRQLKPVLDDDLQGIEIVFDAEEAEPDDKLPFPQPDDHLQQPGSVIVDQNSPRSIVEETVSEVNETRQFSRVGTSRVSNPADENTHSEFSSSRMSVSRPEMALTREPSVSSDRKFSDQSEEPRSSTVKTSNGFDSLGKAVSTGAFPKASASPLQTTVDSHSPANIYTRTTGGQNPAIASQGYYDQKSQPPSQAPLPLMPPLATTSSVFSNPADHTVCPSIFSICYFCSRCLASTAAWLSCKLNILLFILTRSLIRDLPFFFFRFNQTICLHGTAILLLRPPVLCQIPSMVVQHSLQLVDPPDLFHHFHQHPLLLQFLLAFPH